MTVVDPTNKSRVQSTGMLAKGAVRVGEAAANESIMTTAGITVEPKNAMPESPGEKTGGLIFSEGTLKKLETREERYKDENGVFKTITLYKATLTDGTVVEYQKQDPIKDSNGGFKQPSIKKNKDGSIDFEGLQKATIRDTTKNDKYNIIGCKNVDVFADNHGSDSDLIDDANLQLEDGTIIENDRVGIFYNEGDKVTNLYSGYSSCGTYIQEKEHDGFIRVRNTVNEGREMRDVQFLEQGRKKVTEVANGGDKITTEVYSHDGKPLKESYLNATEQVLLDGYKIKTSPDGKEQWFYDPDGNPISLEKFKNRGL